MTNLERSDRVLKTLLEDRARSLGDAPFFRFMDNPYVSFGEANRTADRLAAGFAELGINPGDFVAVLLPNSEEYVLSWFGLSKLGAVMVPINTNYRGEILRYVLNDSRASTYVVDERYLPRLGDVAGELPHLDRVILTRTKDDESAPPDADATGVLGQDSIDLLRFEALVDTPGPAPVVTVDPEDLMFVMYTSGTTGRSKGVKIPHGFHLGFAAEWVRAMRYTEEDHLYTPLPLYHALASTLGVLPTLLEGARMTLAERFSAGAFWDRVERFEASVAHVIFSIPPILKKAPERPDDGDNPLRAMYIAKQDPEFEDRFDLDLFEGYGATEDGLVTYVPIGEDKPVESCGRASPIHEVRIVDENDHELPPGEIGEIVVRPKEPMAIMDGYYRQPEKTLESFRNLWFHTGDLGWRDEEGFFYFHDRKQHFIRRRGENISSYEVQNIVQQHPSVRESAVVGVPSQLGEEEVKTCVVLKPDEELPPEELVAFCADRMADFMVPRYVQYRDSLPKTPTEKIRKFKLREEHEDDPGWDRENPERPRST